MATRKVWNGQGKLHSDKDEYICDVRYSFSRRETDGGYARIDGELIGVLVHRLQSETYQLYLEDGTARPIVITSAQMDKPCRFLPASDHAWPE
jgi:hypothetical protein